jgi:hypothetical protein
LTKNSDSRNIHLYDWERFQFTRGGKPAGADKQYGTQQLPETRKP